MQAMVTDYKAMISEQSTENMKTINELAQSAATEINTGDDTFQIQKNMESLSSHNQKLTAKLLQQHQLIDSLHNQAQGFRDKVKKTETDVLESLSIIDEQTHKQNVLSCHINELCDQTKAVFKLVSNEEERVPESSLE